jgi:hypothetical protein
MTMQKWILSREADNKNTFSLDVVSATILGFAVRRLLWY